MWFRGTNPSYVRQSQMMRLGNNFWAINGIDIIYLDNTNTMQETSHNTSTNTPLADQTWHHVVWIIGNTTPHKVYIDGSLFFTYNAKPFNYYCNGTGSRLCGDWNGAECFVGNVDEIRLYNYILTPKQITDIYTVPTQ